MQPCLGQEGEALSISYIDGDVPRAARRDALRANFFFACDCQRFAGPAGSVCAKGLGRARVLEICRS